MKANRNRVRSYSSFFAALTIIVCVKPFAGALQAQSAPAALQASPSGEARAERSTSSGEHWLDHRPAVEPSADMKCAIVEWAAGSPKPSLVVVCPPEEVFAPLRLYFKLSWKRDADVPGNFQIIAEPKTMIKLHWTSQGDYQVLLPTERKKERNRHREWVSFNDLVGVFIKYQ
jgi:hypothetical protein